MIGIPTKIRRTKISAQSKLDIKHAVSYTLTSEGSIILTGKTGRTCTLEDAFGGVIVGLTYSRARAIILRYNKDIIKKLVPRI